MAPTWWQELDFDWEIEQILLDASDHCGTCGAALYSNGTCPNCDRPRGTL